MTRTQTRAKRSSSHAEARLQERLPPAVAERGYELLRDREALAELIATTARKDPRLDEGDRVALALASQDPCAHLVATRAGDGVTTLAAGMAHTLPTVPFAIVSEFLDWRATLLQARIEVRKHVAESDQSPLVRAIVHPHRVTREEFERLRKLAPLLGEVFRDHIDDAIAATIDVKPPRRAWPDKKLDTLWRLYMRGTLFLTIDGFDCQIYQLLRAARVTDVALSSRAIWHMANRAEETLDAIARLHDKGLLGTVSTLMASLYVLPALATRQPAYRKDAMRLAAVLTPERRAIPLSTISESLIMELTFPLLIHLADLTPFPWKNKDEVTKERINRTAEVAAEILEARGAVPLLELAEAVSPWHAETLRALDPLRAIGTPPQTRVGPTSTLDDRERLRVEMWRGILWNHLLPIRGGDPFMALLVSLAPLEALAPLDAPDPALSLSSGRAYLTRRLFQMKRMNGLVIEAKARAADASRSEAPLVAQNAPCLCGSGKKYKRCCGLKQRRLRRAR